MKTLILRSIIFDDEIQPELINRLTEGYEAIGHTVFVYNMPACDSLEHWAGFAILDNTRNTDILICLDFPTALIKHPRKRIVLTKPLPKDDIFKLAINQAFAEAFDCYKYGDIDSECPYLPSVEEFVSRGL